VSGDGRPNQDDTVLDEVTTEHVGGCNDQCEGDSHVLLADADPLPPLARIVAAIDCWDGDALVTKAHAASLEEHLARTLFDANGRQHPDRPYFDLDEIREAHKPGDPLESLDGRLWSRVIFDTASVACAWEVDGTFHLWVEPEELAELVFKARS